jgi:serine protease
VRQAAARLINTVVLLAILVTAAVFLLRSCSGESGEAAPPRTGQAHAHTDFVPNDPGTVRQAGGWVGLQWNFDGPNGVGAPAAWDNLLAAGHPGGEGVTVAVVDTGVAYADSYPYRRSPDLRAARFVPGFDFVGGDRYPFDLNGHGTHVASTIVEDTDNALSVTGLAYGVQLMPVRVLNRYGAGSASTVARGIRFAADHGADVINVSLSFDWSTTARQIPQVTEALDHAYETGALVVASAGNSSRAALPYPARWGNVLSVGATTEHACKATFSNFGPDLDLVAPGGGIDSALAGDPNCRGGWRGRPIYQMTFRPPNVRSFVLRGFAGTSMATPHVSATAALVIASGVLGPEPSPATITERLEQTARDLGAPGKDARYGWGLVNAAAATAPNPPEGSG